MKTPSSLKWRLALIIGGLALASALGISEYAAHASRQQIAHDQQALLQNIAVRMGTQLAHDMSSRANEILFLTTHDGVRQRR